MRAYNITLILVLAVLMLSLVDAQNAPSKATVCCEQTKNNLFCQNVPIEECAAGSRSVQTSCDSTSFCKPGVCYNPNEGTCAGNTPQFVCNQNGGTWSETNPPQCDLGCCTLGDQAAFVTLVRCKYLSGLYGLNVNYNKQIKDEVQCALTAQNQDKGACVYESDFEKFCKFTTREECTSGVNGSLKSKGQFFKDRLCTDPELATKCERTTKTTCVDGKEEVYFVDTCGNPANIYDASKVNDNAYWSKVVAKLDSCGIGSSNSKSKTCGNCNYMEGSICRAAGKEKPTYGGNVCADLNCEKTSNGNSYRHGESWCVFGDKGEKDKSNNAVGSRFYKHICINGEEVIESCEDYRNQECVQDTIDVPSGKPFYQAACRVNRWQDCVFQGAKDDCENYEKRDCVWKEGFKASFANSTEGVCLPKNSPGLKFWEGESAKQICGQGSETCVVTVEKGLTGGEKCVKNCDCLTGKWLSDKKEICAALGDCGVKINWIGQSGYKTEWNVTIK